MYDVGKTREANGETWKLNEPLSAVQKLFS